MTTLLHKSLSNVRIKDADAGTVEAVFSTFNVVDKDGDVTLPGAIKDGAEVVISAYGHTSHSGMLPVGKGVIRTTDTEAIMDGTFFLNTAAGRDTFTVVKELGGLGEWSYSLHDVISEPGVLDGQSVNYLKDITVKEVSPVLIGAGVNTRTLSAKGVKFLDEGKAVVSAVGAFVERAEEVLVLRAEKGRTLGGDTTDVLKSLRDSLAQVEALLVKAEGAAEPVAAEIPEDVRLIAADVRRRELFSQLPEEKAS